MTVQAQKSQNQRKLLDACQRAGLPRSSYNLNPEGTVLHVLDGATVRPFGCSNRSLLWQIERSVREILEIGANRLLRTKGAA